MLVFPLHEFWGIDFPHVVMRSESLLWRKTQIQNRPAGTAQFEDVFRGTEMSKSWVFQVTSPVQSFERIVERLLGLLYSMALGRGSGSSRSESSSPIWKETTREMSKKKGKLWSPRRTPKSSNTLFGTWSERFRVGLFLMVSVSVRAASRSNANCSTYGTRMASTLTVHDSCSLVRPKPMPHSADDDDDDDTSPKTLSIRVM